MTALAKTAALAVAVAMGLGQLAPAGTGAPSAIQLGRSIQFTRAHR